MSLGIDAALDRFEADQFVALVLFEGAGERGLWPVATFEASTKVPKRAATPVR